MRPQWNTVTLKTEWKIQEYSNLFGCKFGHYMNRKLCAVERDSGKALEIFYANEAIHCCICSQTLGYPSFRMNSWSERDCEVYEAFNSLWMFIWELGVLLDKSHVLWNQWFKFISAPIHSQDFCPCINSVNVCIPLSITHFSLPVSSFVPRNIT